MIDVGGAALSLATALLASVATIGVQWLRGRDERHRADNETDIKIEEHRDGLTVEMLELARSEIKDLRSVVSELRPLVPKLAHLDEALDHLHALLHSCSEGEQRAAERRAAAFLRRMRGIEAKGDERNSVQRAISGENLKRDARGEAV